MAKSKGGNGNAAVEDAPATDGATTEAPAAVANFVLHYRREHPGNRCSYGIAGNAGIVVFDKGLFQGSDQAGFQAPAVITLDCEMVPIKQDNKTAKAEAAAAKLVEKAQKAQAKILAAQAKAEERQKKADEALRKAQEKVAAATSGKTASAEGETKTEG